MALKHIQGAIRFKFPGWARKRKGGVWDCGRNNRFPHAHPESPGGFETLHYLKYLHIDDISFDVRLDPNQRRSPGALAVHFWAIPDDPNIHQE